MAHIVVLHENGLPVVSKGSKSQPKAYLSLANAQIAIKNMDSVVYDKSKLEPVWYCPANDAITHVFAILEINMSTLVSKMTGVSYKKEEDADRICETLNKINEGKGLSFIYQKVSVN